jgi:hypothetical protein
MNQETTTKDVRVAPKGDVLNFGINNVITTRVHKGVWTLLVTLFIEVYID